VLCQASLSRNSERQNFECSFPSTFDILLFEVAFSIEPAACKASRQMVA
jgi:hypothetical protein